MKFILIALVVLSTVVIADTTVIKPLSRQIAPTPSNGTEVDHPIPDSTDSTEIKKETDGVKGLKATQRMEDSASPTETTKKTKTIDE